MGRRCHIVLVISLLLWTSVLLLSLKTLRRPQAIFCVSSGLPGRCLVRLAFIPPVKKNTLHGWKEKIKACLLVMNSWKNSGDYAIPTTWRNFYLILGLNAKGFLFLLKRGE